MGRFDNLERSTYISQFVPLPTQQLMGAGQAMRQTYFQNQQRGDMIEEWITNVPHTPHDKELLQDMNKEIHNELGQIERWEHAGRDVRRVAKNVQTSPHYKAIASNAAMRQKYFEDLDSRENLSPERRDKAKAYSDTLFQGTVGPDGKINTYNGIPIHDDFDFTGWFADLDQQIQAAKTSGYHLVGEDGTEHIINVDTEERTAAVIQDIVQRHVMLNPNLRGFLRDEATFNTGMVDGDGNVMEDPDDRYKALVENLMITASETLSYKHIDTDFAAFTPAAHEWAKNNNQAVLPVTLTGRTLEGGPATFRDITSETEALSTNLDLLRETYDRKVKEGEFVTDAEGNERSLWETTNEAIDMRASIAQSERDLAKNQRLMDRAYLKAYPEAKGDVEKAYELAEKDRAVYGGNPWNPLPAAKELGYNMAIGILRQAANMPPDEQASILENIFTIAAGSIPGHFINQLRFIHAQKTNGQDILPEEYFELIEGLEKSRNDARWNNTKEGKKVTKALEELTKEQPDIFTTATFGNQKYNTAIENTINRLIGTGEFTAIDLTRLDTNESIDPDDLDNIVPGSAEYIGPRIHGREGEDQKFQSLIRVSVYDSDGNAVPGPILQTSALVSTPLIKQLIKEEQFDEAAIAADTKFTENMPREGDSYDLGAEFGIGAGRVIISRGEGHRAWQLILNQNGKLIPSGGVQDSKGVYLAGLLAIANELQLQEKK